MASHEADPPRSETDQSLRDERERSDEELLVRSDALAEDSDQLIQRARERARMVLELSREREDHRLSAIGTTAEVHEAVRQQRRTADAALATEHATADAQRLDERELRHAAVIELLAFERGATDKTLAAERSHSDRGITAREDLLAVVAHDLRNMLQTVVVNASVILMARDLPTTTVPAAQVQRVGAQMAKLLEDLLDFSKFAAGKLTLAATDVDIVQVVRDAVSIHSGVATAHRLTLTMRSDVDALTIIGDGRRLTRLLINLITNALKYTPEGGRIDVSVAVIDGECEIAVADNGVGIAKDQLQSIFERYEQGTGPQRASGVGLGLYIARLIAEAHRGRVWAESESPVGSRFRLRLPIKPTAT